MALKAPAQYKNRRRVEAKRGQGERIMRVYVCVCVCAVRLACLFFCWFSKTHMLYATPSGISDVSHATEHLLDEASSEEATVSLEAPCPRVSAA